MSFRVKLTVYFLLLSLAPLAATFAAFGSVLAGNETRAVDSQLQAALRVAVADYAEEARARGESPPTGDALADRLRFAAGLRESQRLALVENGLVAAASPDLAGAADVPGDHPRTADVGSTRYRALAADAPGHAGDLQIAVLSPQADIDAAQRRVWLWLLLAFVASLGAVALAAYLVGRSIVAALRRLVDASRGIAAGNLSQRVPAEGGDEFARLGDAFNDMADQLEARLHDLQEGRRRLRDATIRFGEALASTSNSEQLVRSIVETAMELTRAEGGHVVLLDGRVVEVGDPDAGPAHLELPLKVGETHFGSLELRGAEFSIQDLESVSLLAGHAVVALENARLQRILERQALVDELTGLYNRRAGEQALTAELARSRRFGSPLALVFADLDHFKGVNDHFGHPVGDLVLREFAAALSASLREGDMAVRWGGEEFCLILPGTDAAGAATLAERIRAAVAERTILTEDGTRIGVTASFGVASRPPMATAGELVAAADGALYEAKRAGRNRVAVAATRVGVS